MAGGAIQSEISQHIESRSAMRFVDRMPKKIDRIKRAIVYAAAKQVHDRILKRIPDKPEFRDMRSGIRLNEIGTKESEPAYSVNIPSRGRRIRTIDQPRTVVYVRAIRSRMTRTDPRIQYLEDHGPWTSDTIPFWPSDKQAVIVQRKVSKREADQIATKQKKAASKVRRELGDIGARIGKEVPSKQPGRAKAIPDVAYAVNQLEFGGGQGKRVPAWKLSLLELLRINPEKLLKGHAPAMKMIKNPGSTADPKYPSRAKKIKMQEARVYMPFMKRFGIRG